MIFRNDDFSSNSDVWAMGEMYKEITVRFPDADIVTGVSIYCKDSNNGALYPRLPLKNQTNEYLYNVDKQLSDIDFMGDIASHGLFHVPHGTLSEDAQKMSILGSCNYLKTKKFIAPFNSYNQLTAMICRDNGIELITEMYPWKCLDYNVFDSSYKYWSFHSWRYTPKTFKEKLDADIAKNDSE